MLSAVVVAGQNPPTPATLVLRNGKIVTVDAAIPEAQAIAIRGDRIVAVGTNQAIQAFVGSATQVIDLRGQLAIPGLVESHGHFMGLGQSKLTLDLMDVKDWDEIVAMVAAAATQAKPGEWILGRGWHQEKWASTPKPNVEGFPFHDALSKVSPNNPVMLTHASGHATFVNAKAMEAANLTRTTVNPSGGEILKDATGRPIGLLRETASGIVGRAYEQWRSAKTAAERDGDARRQVQLAVQASLEKGVTSFQDAGSSFSTIDLLKQVASEGGLGIRLWVMVRDSNDNLRAKLAQYRAVGLNDHHLTIAAIKVVADGALGSRGAWLLEPYSDSPASVGLPTNSPESIAQTSQIALEHDLQLCVHAIGDRANREVLNVYERAFKSRPDQKDLRWRIEHAQHISAADIPRFGRLGVIPVMQAIHATSDAPYVLARLGHRRAEEGAYVWQKLMQSGAIIANGTDVPVERIDPMANFHATITRKTLDGSVFFGDQKMSRAEALKSYTWNGAFAAKEETLKGSLVVGKLADITVLSKDIMTVAEDEIPSTQAVYTIVGGKIAYRRQP
ncbi:MAG: amidohydrolase [Acidobacterium sp.]|nr:amidohydrolase [Acidobacteriota bacterium]PHY10510.1 MAG: amidohydrolase [Acidobacterium sp.]